MESFAEYGIKVKFFRKRAHLSQFELEIKTGLASGMICRIEKGLTNPSKETLQRIAKALQLTSFEVAYLFGIDTNQLLNTPKELVINTINGSLQTN
jgi:transcriptional regulator with XRE-family HTH domain